MILQNEFGQERVSYSFGSQLDGVNQTNKERTEKHDIDIEGQKDSTIDDINETFDGKASVIVSTGKSITSSQGLSYGSKSNISEIDGSINSSGRMPKSEAAGSIIGEDMSRFGLSGFDSNESQNNIS